MNLPLNRDELRERWETGERFDFYFFYGHKPPATGVDASCLSQWFESGFTIDDIYYPTAEHWMMAEKARLFDDPYHLDQIIAAPDPRTAKAFGRKVRGFDQEKWNAERFDIVYRGNVAKFDQDEELGEFLGSTYGTILVEAAGRDVIWGIGLGQNNPKAQNPITWRGRNLLGFVLTKVRESQS